MGRSPSRSRAVDRLLALPAAAVLFAYCLSACLANAEQTPAAEARVIISASGRFSLVGTNAEELLLLSRSAESAAGRFERVTGLQFRPRPGSEPRLVLRSRAAASRTATVSMGSLIQTVVVGTPDATEYREAATELCTVMLAACVAGTLPDGVSPRRVPDVPWWLASGIAGALEPEFRVADRHALSARSRETAPPSIREVMAWQSPPTGVQCADGFCAAAVSLIAGDRERRAIFAGMVKAMAEGPQPDPAILTGLSKSWHSDAELNKQWLRHLDAESAALIEPGTLRPEQFIALRETLVAFPGSDGVPADDGLPSSLDMHALIPLKSRKWMKRFCATKIAELKIMAVGRPPEFVEPLDNYVKFLDALGSARKARTLERLLAVAETALRAAEDLAVRRKAYMDEMEAIYGSGHDMLEPSGGRLYGKDANTAGGETSNELFEEERRLMENSPGGGQ